ncbi:Putative two-component system [Elusimicrobium minutum Pei191]|uniref:histidine kinase n=1 Tax=Elusimicrobium minutum (strain Pei191) TaxID=445932 RepID=B2KBQ1_ELUMP|nr:HAMP domain-containing sensor histidine kinase [Elusimicrobium minutum]ACC97738.1 Putative two-component system [Elusimicrobium minutum Pei191]
MTNKDDIASRVLALVSHKLRTPLSIINGYSEAIIAQKSKEKFSPFTEKAFEEINKQGQKLAILVDKLLRFTKIEEMSQLEIVKNEVNLKSLLKEASAECIVYSTEGSNRSIIIKSNNISRDSCAIEIICPDDLMVNIDANYFKMAIKELIDNAIKFNNHIERLIKIYCTKNTNYVSISIKDTGTGIRPGEISRLFEKFYQIDDYFTGQIEGWGLGLPYVKKVMDLHGGSVSVVSDQGSGSVFTLNIPN